MTPSDDCIDQWLDSLRANGVSENTLRAYRADLKGFQAAMANPAPWLISSDLPETAAGQYLNSGRSGWAPKTTRRKLTALRSWGKYTYGHPQFLSFYRGPIPAPPEPHPLPGGIESVVTMAFQTQRPTEQALVVLCGLCGLRVGEATTVRFSHLDLSPADGARLLVRGKGDKSRRVPVSDRAMAVLTPRIEEIRLDVFDNDPRIAPFPDRTARDIITRLGTYANIGRPVASHDLRATAATAWYNATKDIRVVQMLLGHASIETTQLYLGVTTAAMRQAVNL
jgi:site-specific recombinase XerD